MAKPDKHEQRPSANGFFYRAKMRIYKSNTNSNGNGHRHKEMNSQFFLFLSFVFNSLLSCLQFIRNSKRSQHDK